MTKKKVTGLKDLLERLDGIDESIASLKAQTVYHKDQLKGIHISDDVMRKRMEEADTRACKIEQSLGDHYIRLQAIEGKAPPPVVENVDLRKALMGDVGDLNGQLALSKAETIRAAMEINKLKMEKETLILDRSNRAKQHEIDQDAIRGLENQNSDLIRELEDARRGREVWKERAMEKLDFTIDVVRIHKCVQSHRWVEVVRFETETSKETTPACLECGQLPLYSTPTLLRYPSGGLAEIKGVGDLHAKEYFL